MKWIDSVTARSGTYHDFVEYMDTRIATCYDNYRRIIRSKNSFEDRALQNAELEGRLLELEELKCLVNNSRVEENDEQSRLSNGIFGTEWRGPGGVESLHRRERMESRQGGTGGAPGIQEGDGGLGVEARTAAPGDPGPSDTPSAPAGVSTTLRRGIADSDRRRGLEQISQAELAQSEAGASEAKVGDRDDSDRTPKTGRPPEPLGVEW